MSANLLERIGAGILKTIRTIRGTPDPEKKQYGRGYEPLPAPLIRAFNKQRPLGPRRLLCYAPFKMMYFAFGGEVIACCHNRRNILGRYPEQDLMAIWKGSAYERLRDFIRNDDLGNGCEVCRNLLMSENFDGAKNALYDRYEEGGWPLTMEFELDNRCNCACIICNDLFSTQIKGDHERSNPYDSRFAEQLRPFIPHLKEAKFYGGEPFLIPLYYEIWDLMTSINPDIRILVQTNGTILNDKVRKLLKKGRFSINVSIDSLDAERFEVIRKNADFRTVMENTKWFANYCRASGSHFGIIPTPNRMNGYELAEITRWAGELGGRVYFNTLITPLELALWNLPPPELRNIHSKLSGAALPSGTPAEKANLRHFRDFLKQLQAWAAANEKMPVSPMKTALTRQQLSATKALFLQRLEHSLREKPNRESLMELFHYSLSAAAGVRNSDLVYMVLDKIPIQEIIAELETGNRDRVTLAAAKKLFESEGLYKMEESVNE